MSIASSKYNNFVLPIQITKNILVLICFQNVKQLFIDDNSSIDCMIVTFKHFFIINIIF